MCANKPQVVHDCCRLSKNLCIDALQDKAVCPVAQFYQVGIMDDAVTKCLDPGNCFCMADKIFSSRNDCIHFKSPAASLSSARTFFSSTLCIIALCLIDSVAWPGQEKQAAP